MNRTLTTLMLSLFATVGVASLHAEQKAVANIPFDFEVGSTTMPAGKYGLGQPNPSWAGLFSISDNSGHSVFVGSAKMGSADPDTSKLTFACHAGECRLAKIEIPGSSVSYSLKLPNSTYGVGMASMISVRLTH